MATASFFLAATPVVNFLKRQLRFMRHEIEQPLLVRLERRAIVAGTWLRLDAASGPPIEPTHRRRGCKIEQTRHLPPALSLLYHRNERSRKSHV